MACEVFATITISFHITRELQFVLGILGDSASAGVRSGAGSIQRGVSRGDQNYTTDPRLYPLGKPIPKLESRAQCTGEAEYAGDIPPMPGELHAALVYSDMANCELDTVDPAPAMALAGVVAYVDHSDIPGANHVCSFCNL